MKPWGVEHAPLLDHLLVPLRLGRDSHDHLLLSEGDLLSNHMVVPDLLPVRHLPILLLLLVIAQFPITFLKKFKIFDNC